MTQGVRPVLTRIVVRYSKTRFKSALTGKTKGRSHPDPAIPVSTWRGRPNAARQIGSTAAILGHPIFSLVAAARLVGERGDRLEPGDLVMAGGATAAETLVAGDFVELSVERLGSVSFKVAE